MKLQVQGNAAEGFVYGAVSVDEDFISFGVAHGRCFIRQGFRNQ